MLELLKFDTVMVFIDARHEGVKVPEPHNGQFDLRLNFDYEFGIDDFRVLPDRLEASLSFPEGEFFCVVPFEAIYLIVCHAIQRGSLFVESVPSEMLHFFFDPSKQDVPAEARKPFKVIETPIELDKAPAATEDAARHSREGGNPDPTAEKPTPPEGDNQDSPKEVRRKGHLRLIK